MVNRAIDFLSRPGDLRFEQGDPLVQFVDRQGVEILLGELAQRVVRWPWLDVIDIHGHSVDPIGDAVNKPVTNGLFRQVP